MNYTVTIKDNFNKELYSYTFGTEKEAIDCIQVEWQRIYNELLADGYELLMEGWHGEDEAQITCDGKTIDFTLRVEGK